MAQVKGTQVGGGSGSTTSKTTSQSASKDTSAYWSSQSSSSSSSNKSSSSSSSSNKSSSSSSSSNKTSGGSTTSAYKEAQSEKFAQKKAESKSSTTLKSDTSAYWQAQRDRDVETATKYKNEKSDTSAYWQNLQVSANAEEEKRMKILEYKEQKRAIEQANAELEKAAKDLKMASEELQDATSGTKSNRFFDWIRSIIDGINKNGEKNNKELDSINGELKKLGEDSGNNGKYNTTEIPTEKNKDDGYKWNTDIVGTVSGLVEDATLAIGKTVADTYSKLRGYEDTEDLIRETKLLNKDLEEANKEAEETEKQNKTLVESIKDSFSSAKEGIADWWGDLWDGDDNADTDTDTDTETDTDKNNGGLFLKASAAEIETEVQPSTANTSKKPESQGANYEGISKNQGMSDEEERKVKEALITGQSVAVDVFGGELSRAVVTKDGMVRVYAPGAYGLDENAYVEYTSDEFFNDILPQTDYLIYDDTPTRRTSFRIS